MLQPEGSFIFGAGPTFPDGRMHDVKAAVPLGHGQGVVVVCVGVHPKTPTLLRTAKRRARELGVPWIAVYVEKRHASRNPYRFLVWQMMTLAGQMGAETLHVQANSAYEGIANLLKDKQAKGEKIAYLVVGSTANQSFWDKIRSSLSDKLVKLGREYGPVEVVPLETVINVKLPWKVRVGLADVRVREIFYALLSVAAAYFCAELLRAFLPRAIFRINDDNVALLFMIACAFTAGRWGLWPGLLASITSFATLNFFYVVPYYHFVIDDVRDILSLILFVSVSVVISFFVSHRRTFTEMALRRERKTQALLYLHRITQRTNTRHKVLEALNKELAHLLETEVALFLPSAENPDALEPLNKNPIQLSFDDKIALETAWEEGKTTGLASSYHSESHWRFEPIFTSEGQIAVLGVHLPPKVRIDVGFGMLVSTIAEQVGLIIERVDMSSLMESTRVSEEREKLRSMLLSSVSHDLKTPLASIIGSLSVYRSMGKNLPEHQKNTLMETALEEAQRLDSFITNILDMTRIESGEIKFKQDWHNPRELMERIQRRMRDRLHRHQFTAHPSTLPVEVWMDAMMTEQVLQNVLDNAAKYTPLGTAIELSCHMRDGNFVYEIRDHGKGIPEDKIETIFDKYSRLHHEDSKIAGTGLGLAISRSVMHAQEGAIKAMNHPDGGAVFLISFSKWRDLPAAKAA